MTKSKQAKVTAAAAATPATAATTPAPAPALAPALLLLLLLTALLIPAVVAAAPAPALAPAPAPRSSSRPAYAELCTTPCLAYINSTLASKSDGACYNTINKEKRCFRYSSRYKYVEIESSEARKLAY